MLKIAIVGGYDFQQDPQTSVQVREFARLLTARLVERGHTLLGAAQTALDADVAMAAEAAAKLAGRDLRQHLQSWIFPLDSRGAPCEQSHRLGRLQPSERPNWDPATSVLGVPEPIEHADVIIFLCGYEGTRRAFFWAEYLRKPILPVAYFGGAAQEIFKAEKQRFAEKYALRMRREDYEELSEIGLTADEQVQTVVRLIEDIAHPRKVVTAMSYAGMRADDPELQALERVFERHQRACERYGYICDRVNHLNVEGRIVEEVYRSIRNAAFLIADLTLERPNVMYEIGFAHGLGKSLVFTAREGTVKPFDLYDSPILYWTPASLDSLEADLLVRIGKIAANQGRRLVKDTGTEVN